MPDASQRALEFTTLTASGESYEIQFPLHPHTGSEEAVAGLLSQLLDTTTRFIQAHNSQMQNGDILQALAMALAVRTQMLPARPETGRQLSESLVSTAISAAGQAIPRRVGHA